MNNRQKVIEFSKRLLVNAAMNALPGSVQLLVDSARDFQELFLAAPEEERVALVEGAREMTEAEANRAHAEIVRETGIEDQVASNLILESLRGIRVTERTEQEVLRSVNATLSAATGGEATISPRRRTLLSVEGMGTMMGARTRRVEFGGEESWPAVEGFEIRGVLGAGASGVVYLAQQTSEGGANLRVEGWSARERDPL